MDTLHRRPNNHKPTAMINDIEVNSPIHETGNKGFKVKTKPRKMQPFKGSKIKRDSDINLGLIIIVFALFVVVVLIYKGVLNY